MVTFDDLKSGGYLFKDSTLGFAVGRRNTLRYALESAYAFYTRVNLHGLQPFEYINFARNNVASGTNQGAIDGLSNAKRAIHLTVNKLFEVWGLKAAYSKARFPEKLEVMQALNAFPVRLINTLNQKRNLIEHEYKTIRNDEAVDFVDIAEMFLMLTHPYLRHAVVGAFVGTNHDERCLEWSVDIFDNEITICEIPNQKFIDTPIGRVYYDIRTEKHTKHLVQTIKINRNNQPDWLTYLDLFVYLTKKNAHHLPEPDDRGHGLYICDYRIAMSS